MSDQMFHFSGFVSAVRCTNTLRNASRGLVIASVCLAACGGESDPPKGSQEPQGQGKAGAAEGGAGSAAGASGSRSNEAGRSGGTAGTGRAANGGTGGSSVKPAADGGKGGSTPAQSDAGAGGTGGSSGDSAGEGGSGEPDSQVAVDAIAASLATAVCDALKGCVGQAKLAMLTGREDCLARYSAGFAQDAFGTLAESIGAGAIKLDETKLDSCYSDTRALGCDLRTERLPPSCQEAIGSQRNIGDTCSLDADCAGDSFCPVEATCPRSCTATHGAGDACTRDAECQRGAICDTGTCKVPVATDGPCAGDSGNVCKDGESCLGSDDTQPGACVANATVQSGALGAECSPGGTLCREGLSCALENGAFKCVAAVARGATCRLALPTQCPIDSYCTAADVTVTGTCAALPAEGKACVQNNQCAPGHVCVTQGGTATCRKLGDVGDTCVADGLCRSGKCTDGSCALRDRCE